MAPVALVSIAFAGQVVNLLNYMRGHSLLSYSELLQKLEGYSIIGSAVHWARENCPRQRRSGAGLAHRGRAEYVENRRHAGR